jgi:hypothetical protein
MSSSPNIRVVHSPAPADDPSHDLNIWSPAPSVKSGLFTEPVLLSDAMCDFLHIPHGSLRARSDVTRAVIAYTKVNGLMHGQKITKDETLVVLLNLKEEDSLCILNLQRFMTPHYTSQKELEFQEWWHAHEDPLWVGVNVTGFSGHALASILRFMTKARYSALTFVLYLDAESSDADAPCGCHGYDSVCEHHRNPEDSEVADCGCSDCYGITCPYHA